MSSFLFGARERMRSGVWRAVTAIAFLVGTVTSAAAQQGTVRGQVTDAVTQRPIIGAQVSVAGTQRGTVTNSAGEFVIPNVPLGSQTVQVDNIGFRSAEEIVDVIADQTATVNFALTQAAIDQIGRAHV